MKMGIGNLREKPGNHKRQRMDEEYVAEYVVAQKPRGDGDQEFIETHGLDLASADDSLIYLVHSLEKFIKHRNLPATAAAFRNNCLESRLENKTVDYTPDKEDNVKIVLGVSGAGKTRMLLELLHARYGYYFTAKSSVRDFGSDDLDACYLYCIRFPLKAEKAIRLLYYVRAAVCNYLQTRLNPSSPSQILLAQLHPRAYFGIDVFKELFDKLILEPKFNTAEISDPFDFVAIDEIQWTLLGESIFSVGGISSLRPFFSALVRNSKRLQKFPTFLIAGTGINYEYLKEATESCTMKSEMITSYRVVSPFGQLSKSQIEKFATQFLSERNVAEYQEVVKSISEFELCHGRPRFLAFILDGFMNSKSKDIESAIGEFLIQLYNLESPIFPLAFLKSDMDKGLVSFDRVISGENLGSIIRDGLLEFILKGKFSFTVRNDTGVAAIQYGLGFAELEHRFLKQIWVREVAILECLRFFIPFADLVGNFAKRMYECVNPQTVGYLVEYLVAFALVANTGDTGDVDKIVASQSSPKIYLQHGRSGEVCFPGHMCGPDIIYKCAKTRTVYIVQVKFVKQMSKQESVKACNTTKSKYFYCKRLPPHETISGYKEEKLKLQETLHTLTNLPEQERFLVKQILVIHSEGKASEFTDGASLITKKTAPKFFSQIGDGIWEYLDKLRDRF